MRVKVLMSSYNGEAFIEKQINSILAQKNVEVDLLIRDDGSTDSTPSVIKRKANEDSRVSYIAENNIGVKRSFLKLLGMAGDGYDYYALSDQDDIWLPYKLDKALGKLSGQDQRIPLIYGSPVYVYEEGKITGVQFKCPSPKLGNFLVKNYYPGCTMVFNKSLFELVNKVDYKELNDFPLHDHWINLVCTACGGKVILDDKAYILYRQHDDNVVGNRSFIQKLKCSGILDGANNKRYKICCELDKYYRRMFSENARSIVDLVMRYNENPCKRVALARSIDVKPFLLIERIRLVLIILLGRY